MKRNVRIEPEADDEIRAATEWYEERRRGLGHAFVAAVDEALVTTRFPYSVVFLLVDDEIVVIAIAHMKREPRYWISRLDR